MSAELNEAPCDICLAIVHDEDANYCMACAERVCYTHIQRCDSCGEFFCEDCQKPGHSECRACCAAGRA